MEPAFDSLPTTTWPRERVLRSTLWAYAETIALAVLATPVLFVLRLVSAPFDPQLRLAGEVYRRVVLTAVRLNPLWRCRLAPGTPPRCPPASVVVSNHVSLADTFFIKHLPWPELKFLGKWEALVIPFIGWNMTLVGDVAIRRGDRRSAKRAMKRCGEWLEAGASVLIYPEGTRQQSTQLGTFKDGAFRLAIEHQRPIVPVVVRGADRAVPRRGWRLGPADGEVEVLDAIPTTGLTLDDMPALKDRVRAAMLTAL